jgi:FAD/FMN-containing dehydrogenase
MLGFITDHSARLDPLALDLLRLTLPGRVFTPGDAGYDAARAGFSLSDTPTPDVVIAAQSAADVVAAVYFAHQNNLPVGVHATGHNFGHAFDGGVRIKTSAMQGVTIDPVARTARVEAGVRWGAVVAAAQKHGLAPLNGSAPHVGVVGYTLFGGFGWLLRKYGAAVDSVIAAEVVTADGQLRRVSENREADLFWALRGASGNFGIVTALEFKLYPVTEVYGGAMFFPMERAPEVFAAYGRLVAGAPEELTSAIVLMRVPPLPHIPEFLRGKSVVTVRAAFLGAEADGARLLAPLRALDGLIADTFRMLPYAQIGTIANDPQDPSPTHRATAMLQDLSPATIEALLRVNGSDGSAPVTVLEIRHLGGAMTRVAPHSTAFTQRYAPFIMQTIGVLAGPAAGAIVPNTRRIAEALRPHSTGGVLPSWLGDGDYGVERMAASFAPAHYARLVELKRRYDPSNMFRQNHNIPPEEPEAGK